MHVSVVRRLAGKRWSGFSKLAAIAATLQVVFLVCPERVIADTHVELVAVRATDAYEVRRVYAGETVARRSAELGFKQGGEIEQVAVDLGDRVTAGAVLAALDTDALEARVAEATSALNVAAANANAVDAQTELARNTEERYRKLLQDGHISRQQYDEYALSLRAQSARLDVARAELARAKAGLKSAEIALSDAYIEAPFDGVIQDRSLDEGSQVGPGQAVLRLVETGRIEAHVGLPADVAGAVGETSSYLFSWNEMEVEGRRIALLPEIDPATRTQTAVFELAEDGLPLGAVVELQLVQSVPTPGYWVPLSALTAADRGLWGVYTVTADSRTERRLVEVIHTEAHRVYVRGTLRDGDMVVANGVQRIVPGQKVAVSETRHAGGR